MKRSRIFISHSREDTPFCDALVSEIRKEKIFRPWIDTEHIVVGVNMLGAMREGLSAMDIFIILISRASLGSAWVKEEVECALRKYLEGESLAILPFIIDDTELKKVELLHPFLLNRFVARIPTNLSGVSAVVQGIHAATNLPRQARARQQSEPFEPDPEIERLVRDVALGDWYSALNPAFAVLTATDARGENQLFQRLIKYQDCPNEDLAWSARMTIETLVDLAPELFDRQLLVSMSESSNFSVRGSAASICLNLAQFAPDHVPLDVAMKLARYDEDWYVSEPATAALKSICKDRRNVLHFFFSHLSDSDPQARAHAARALRGIAAEEPEILDPKSLRLALRDLTHIGDKEAAGYITEALRKVSAVKQQSGFKYGLGE